jgi:hypothetical protein
VDERIKLLCARAVSAPESETSTILSELRSLIRESLIDASNLATATFLEHERSGQPGGKTPHLGPPASRVLSKE